MQPEPVIKAVLNGTRAAKRKYDNWSGGWYLHGAEYVATFCIADAVKKVDGVSYVTVESNVRNAIKDAGGSLRGVGLKTVPQGYRFDIAVWNTKEIRGVIEVKTSVWGFSYIEKDIAKVCSILGKVKLVRWGLIAYFASMRDGSQRVAKERLRNRTENIFVGARDYLADSDFSAARHNSRIEVEGDSAWTCEVLEITKRN